MNTEDLFNDIFTPLDLISYTGRAVDGVNDVVVFPDWKNDRIRGEYENLALITRDGEACIRSAVPKEIKNHGFRLKIDGEDFYISHNKISDGNWVKLSVNSKAVPYFYKMLSDLLVSTPKNEEGCYENISIAFSDKFPGVPFFISRNMSSYRSYIINGTKRMLFTTATLFGKKRTKNWKVGSRYIDSYGNGYSIIAKLNINADILNMLNESLKEDKAVKKHSGERQYVKAVVDILNSETPTTETKGSEIHTSSMTSVYLYAKDLNSNLKDMLENRGLDVYDELKDFSLQIIPTNGTVPAFEVGEVFTEEDRKNNPVNLETLAKNTVKLFERDGKPSQVIATLNKLGDGAIENLIYISSLADPVTAKEDQKACDILKGKLDDRLRKTILFDPEVTSPTLSYAQPISTIDTIKRSSLFISRLIKYSDNFETAFNYLNTHIVNFSELFGKSKEEVKDQSKFLFSSWDNYRKYIDYSTIPYIVQTQVELVVEVDENTLKNGITTNSRFEAQFGPALSGVILEIINTAIDNNGCGVHGYYENCSISKKGEKVLDCIKMTVTSDDVINHLNGNVPVPVQSDILISKFYKTPITVKLVKKAKKED